MVWHGRDPKDHLITIPCNGQGHLSLDQVAQSPTHPSLQHFWVWDCHTFPGNLFHCLTTLTVKNFFLIPNLNLT